MEARKLSNEHKCKCTVCGKEFGCVGRSLYCYDCSVKLQREKKQRLKDEN